MSNTINNDSWDIINKMNKKEVVAQIMSFGGNLITIKSDASDSHVDMEYKGWIIKASGQTLIDAYKYVLDAIYCIREDFSDLSPSIIYSI